MRGKVLIATLMTMACSAAMAVPSVFPTGVTRYDPAKAYNSFVVFGGTDEKTHLIDMDGNEVHRWEYQGFPSEILDPAVTKGAKGHVLVHLETSEDAATGTVPGVKIYSNKTIGELDWEGKVVWQWGKEAPGGLSRQHHDWARLANGNTLVLANLSHKVPGFTLPEQLDDVIYEIGPGGKIVWRWVASEHLDEYGFTPEQLAAVKAAPTPDFFHFNDMTPVGPNRWYDAGDRRFAPDNILVDSRNANFVVIIDKATGKIVWRLGPDLPHLGPPRPAKAGEPRQADQFVGQHDAHIIPKGLPGAGNLLLFDNQGEAGYPPVPLSPVGGSRVLEIDPVTRAVVWSYTADASNQPLWGFYSSFISSARRLPNGNTLIDEGMNGRFFQVTPAGEIVWEYVSPYFSQSNAGGAAKAVSANWVYRAQPVPYDWVPAGTLHTEQAVTPPDLTYFRVPGAPAAQR